MLGAYQLLAPLGQGGMATVYKAFHARLNRYVAIKMIHAGYADNPSFRIRFEREAQLVAQLEHPHIVPVYDFFDHEGKPCIVMKFVEGMTLKQRLSGETLSAAQLLNILTPLASALDYAHSKGVLHRDIKPSNVLIDSAHTPYLTDFGLAKLTQTGESSISENMLIGTPLYMSPEQAQGGIELDARSDLYSFGVIVYELLTGRVPYHEGTPYAIVHDHIYKPLPLPRSLNPQISTETEQVLLQALAKSPSDRFESAHAMIGALRASLQDTPSSLYRFDDDLTPLTDSVLDRLAAPIYTPSQRRALVIPEPIAPIPAVTPKLRKRRRWLRYGLIAVVILVVWNGLSNIEDRTQADSPVIDSPMIPVLNIIAIPDITLQEAERRLSADSTDPLTYLALARAYLELDRLEDAQQMIATGVNYASDPVQFLASAGSAAVDLEHAPAAIIAYNAAFAIAQETPYAPALRAHAGERLYSLVTRPNALTPIQIRLLLSGLDGERGFNSALINVMVARAWLANGRDALALTVLNPALTNAPELAEVQLVVGEMAQARGEADNARSAYQRALADESAPEWVKARVANLQTSLATTVP
jgi:serine/threonine-protein kinase